MFANTLTVLHGCWVYMTSCVDTGVSKAASFHPPYSFCWIQRYCRSFFALRSVWNTCWPIVLALVITVGQVLIARIFWLRIAIFSTLRNQKNRTKKHTQWIILLMTSPLLLKCSTCVLICTVWYNHVHLSIHHYFKSKVNLPTPSQVQLSPNVLREVNQAVTAALEREEFGKQASKVKSDSTMCLSCLRSGVLLEGVACPLGNRVH